jgi:hypothetical protein
MGKRKFQVGDKIRVVAIPKINFAPGINDELGTKKLFKRMLERVYTVRGFDRHGWVELRPTRTDVAWIEPEFLKLRARRSKTER